MHRNLHRSSPLIQILEARRMFSGVPYRLAGEADPIFTAAHVSSGEEWYDIAVSSQGKFAVVGEKDRISRLTQFNADGSLDTSFAGGRVDINFGPNLEAFTQVLGLPGGKLLAAGDAEDVSGISGVRWAATFAQFNSDGTPDASFGSGGTSAISFGADVGSFSALAVQSTGRILALSNASKLYGVTSTGAKDNSFGSNGTLQLWGTQSATSLDLAVLPDDRFYVVGARWSNDATSSVARIERFLPNGQLDTSFASGGTLEIDLGNGPWDSVRAAAVDSSGRIVVALATGSVFPSHVELRRYLDSGMPDTSFGTAGITDLTQYCKDISAVALDSNQRIVVSGVAQGQTSWATGGVFRCTTDGLMDPSFGLNGRAFDDAINGEMAISSDGDIVGIRSPGSNAWTGRILGANRGDGPVYLQPDGVLNITGAPTVDNLSIAVSGPNLVVTLNGDVTSLPLSSVTSFNADTRNGADLISYDVGDAFAGVVNTIAGGRTSYLFPAPPGANQIDVISGPADGSLVIASNDGVYQNQIRIEPTASVDVTVTSSGDDATLVGSDASEVINWTPTLTTGAGSTVHGRVFSVDAGGGDDLIIVRAAESGPAVLGGDGNDILDFIATSGFFDGGAGSDQLIVTRGNAVGPSSGVIWTYSASVGTSEITYQPNVERLIVNGSDSNETISIAGTLAGSEVELNLFDGDDTVNVGSGSLEDPKGLTAIKGNVQINMDAGVSDRITFNDSTANRPSRLTLSDSQLLADDGTLFGSPGARVKYSGGESVTVNTSPLADVVTVVPSASSSLAIVGGNPKTWPGDEVRLQPSDLSSAVIDLTSAAGGSINIPGAKPISFSGMERLPPVPINPVLSQLVYNFDLADPSLQIVFAFDVASSLAPGDIFLTNLSTGASYPLSAQTMVYDSPSRTATIKLSAFKTAAGDGEWRMWINNTALTDPNNNVLAADMIGDFFILSGDANRDRKIDAIDLGILSTNWQGSGKTFSQGDFNYDGVVDIRDLYILASKWQETLPPPPPTTAPVSGGARAPVRTPTRVVKLIE
jgi:uncharacterized delta-60 repeat protein